MQQVIDLRPILRRRFETRKATFTRYDWRFGQLRPTELAYDGFMCRVNIDGSELELMCTGCGLVVDPHNVTSEADAKERHERLSVRCKYNKLPNVSLIMEEIFVKRMEGNLSARMSTFHNWPRDSAMPADRLADVGFFYTQRGDTVECSFCGLHISNWTESDDPEEVHRSIYGECAMVTDEVPLNPPITRNADPMYLTYISRVSRVDSFANFPWHNADAQAMTSRLTEAGFFYTGVALYVKCFFCGGGVTRPWTTTTGNGGTANDDPYALHAYWFPHCRHLMTRMGLHFVMSRARNPDAAPPTLTDLLYKEIDFLVREAGFKGTKLERVFRINMTDYLVKMNRGIIHRREFTDMVEFTKRQVMGDPPRSSYYEEEEEDVEMVDADQPSSPTYSTTSNDSGSGGGDSSGDEPNSEEEVDSETPPLLPLPTPPAVVTAAVEDTTTTARIRRNGLECTVCLMDYTDYIMYLPCAHIAACPTCDPNLKDCPCCRKMISRRMKVFIP